MIEPAALLALAHAWEARSLSGTGFAIELDPTWLDAARELRTLVAVDALLAFIVRCAPQAG